MTEPSREPVAMGGGDPPPPAVPPPQAAEGQHQQGGVRGSGWGRAGVALAGALLLVVVLVGTGPYWAPALPWGAPARNATAPAARAENPSVAQPQSDQRSQQQEAAASATLARLDRRVGALEARPAAPAGDIADLRQEMTKLSRTTADLGARIEATDTDVHNRMSRAATDTALVLGLQQIRGAVAAGRPFVAEYEAFTALSRNLPEIAKAAAPLAGPAKTGVAGRAALAARLREIGGSIGTANAAANSSANSRGAATDWANEALSRLRGLVTIRRVDEAGESAGPEAVVKAAERALENGDLDGAVAKLDGLRGAPADIARPWLHMAMERLAVEAALDRTEVVLAGRLGTSANPPTGSGTPR